MSFDIIQRITLGFSILLFAGFAAYTVHKNKVDEGVRASTVAELQEKVRAKDREIEQRDRQIAELTSERDRLSATLNDKSARREIQEGLGSFIAEGHRLLAKCRIEKDPPPEAEANDWAGRTENFLSQKLGNAYVARFRSAAGLPLTATSITSIPHSNLWASIYTRMARLEQFSGEYK